MKIERESMVAVVRVFSFSIAGHLEKECPSENFFEVVFGGCFRDELIWKRPFSGKCEPKTNTVIV